MIEIQTFVFFDKLQSLIFPPLQNYIVIEEVLDPILQLYYLKRTKTNQPKMTLDHMKVSSTFALSLSSSSPSSPSKVHARQSQGKP